MKRISILWSGLGVLGLICCADVAYAVPCENNLPASNPDSVYIDHGDGTVTDTRTGLMWKQCAEGRGGAECQSGSIQPFTWTAALAQAEASAFAGYNDWRLPNIKELFSLVEDCRFSPAINTNLFPNTSELWFLSSSPPPHHGDVWSVDSDGFVTRNYPSGLVRLVRGGQ